MKILIFGGSGMVGQSVLREALHDATVDEVILVGRREERIASPKVRQRVLPDVSELGAVEAQLRDCDACFFCLGVSSSGMSEARYRALTYDLTLKVADTLSRVKPGMTFVYVSGAGTDSSEAGRSMWVRVKGATENALLRLPLDAYMLRPGAIQPLYGVRSKTPLYRWTYLLAAPLMPLVRRLWPDQITTSERIGRAMLALAARGTGKRVLETADINALSA
jgi:uncharacterized protein YbjT (DUF2867 family)